MLDFDFYDASPVPVLRSTVSPSHAIKEATRFRGGNGVADNTSEGFLSLNPRLVVSSSTHLCNKNKKT